MRNRAGSWSFLMGLLIALGVACSEKGEVQPTATALVPTPSAVSTVLVGPPAISPSAIHPPVVPAERPAFTWVPSEPILDLRGALEDSDPYAAAWERLKQERANQSDFTDEYRDWRVFVADDAGRPREVLSTTRQVTGVEWDRKNGLVASLMTSRRVPSPILDRDIKYQWEGTATIDPATGSVTTAFEAAPDGLDGAFSGIGGSPAIALHPSGVVSLALSGPGAPGRSFVPYVQNVYGQAQYLDIPLGASRSYGLLGDGKTLAFAGDNRTVNLLHGPSVLVFDTYFMPTSGPRALKVPVIGNLAGRIIDDNNRIDPNEPRTALLTVADSGAGLEPYLALYDSRTNSVHLIAKVPLTIHSSLQWRAPNPNPVIIEMDNQSKQIDLASHVISPAPVPPSYWEEPSPDGSLGIRAIEPDLQKTPTSGKDCTEQAYRVEIADRKTGAVRVFSECDSGYISRGQWVGNEKFVLFVTEARGGRGGPVRSIPLLADVNSGSTKRLLPESIVGDSLEASASGNRFAILAENLLLFDGDGALLRDYGPPPEGYRYMSAAFSPDGSQLAYVLQPAALNFH